MKLFWRHEIHFADMKSFWLRHESTFGDMKFHRRHEMMFSATWNSIGDMKWFSRRHESILGDMKLFWRHEMHFGDMKWFWLWHVFIFGDMRFYWRHETILSATWINIWPHEIISASWSLLFRSRNFFPCHASTFCVGLVNSTNPFMLPAVNMSWDCNTTHHTKIYKCLLNCVLSCLHAELLFVLRIVTAVSISRTGCSVCWQVVQFRSLCGCQTLSAGSVFGGL